MKWYDWHTVTERLQARIYAITRGRPFTVTLDPATQTGVCDFANKQISINPNLFDDVFRRRGLTDTALDQANFLVSRSVTGHEALHVLYSDPNMVTAAAAESPILKVVFNLLEDARIERIGSEGSHVAKTLFRFVNTIAAAELAPPQRNDPGDAADWLDLLLRWRLSAPIPQLQKNAKVKWQKAKTHSDAAIYAIDSVETLVLAREIVKVLNLDRKNTADGSNPMLTKMQSEMSGSRGSEPLPSPLNRESEESDQSEGSGDGNESHGEAKDSHEETDIDDCEDKETPRGETQAEEEPSTDCCSGTDDDSTDQDSTEAQKSVKQEESLEEDEQSCQGQSTNDCEESSVQEIDLEKLIEDVAVQTAEAIDELLPKPEDGLMVAKATSIGRQKKSDIVASPYMPYLPAAIPISEEIVRELKTENPRAVSGASESAGRFRGRYYVRDAQKPFSAQRYRGLGSPKMALTLILDRSASMDNVIEELRIMSIAISMACEKLCIPLSIWCLEGQVHIKRFEETGPQVLAKLAGIEAETYTVMIPTVRDAEKELAARPEQLKQIVLIHDGFPGDGDDFVEWRKTLEGIGLFCLRIMCESEYDQYQHYPQSLRSQMDHLVGPQNHAIAAVGEIAKHWCSFIRNKRFSSHVLL